MSERDVQILYESDTAPSTGLARPAGGGAVRGERSSGACQLEPTEFKYVAGECERRKSERRNCRRAQSIWDAMGLYCTRTVHCMHASVYMHRWHCTRTSGALLLRHAPSMRAELSDVVIAEPRAMLNELILG